MSGTPTRSDGVVARAAEAVDRARGRMARHLASQASGPQLGAFATELFEEIVLDVYRTIIAEVGGNAEARIALIAHGGFGRCEMAPFSDVDLMLLHDERTPSQGLVADVAGRLLKDLFDAGLEVGQSVRTPSMAARLAWDDATVFSSLFDGRPLAGNPELFARMSRKLRAMARRHPRRISQRLIEARRSERRRYGESVAVLEPNVKRSAGALRDVQLVRWLGAIRHDERSFDDLVISGALTRTDADALRRGADFLMRLRFEMHLAAGRAEDDLRRDQQLAIAEARGIGQEGGLLGVERFMREYFSHTRKIAGIAGAMERRSEMASPVLRGLARCFGHRVDDPFRLTRLSVTVPASGVPGVAASLASILRLFELAMLFNRDVDPATLEAIRRDVHPEELTFDSAARARFLALFNHPLRLASALRDLHELGVLERIIPAFSHATGLMQFNNYHKFAVDEHCIHAVEQAASFDGSPGWLGKVWKEIRRRRPLLLALLLHDLGKGHVGDHSVVGARIARETAARFQMPDDEIEIVEYLVANHLAMAHLAFRRNTGDESLVVRFAGDVGSPEVLRMLALLTAADTSAVGPGTWSQWKSDLLEDLYSRTIDYLDGENPSRMAHRNRAALERLLDERSAAEPVRKLVATLPASLLQTKPPEQILEEVVHLAALAEAGCLVRIGWQPATSTLAVTVGTRESVAPGIFHRLAGALSSLRLGILAADIHTFGDGLVLDHFSVHDPDFQGEPPGHRLVEIEDAIRRSLEPSSLPSFRRVWGAAEAAATGPAPRVRIDNESSDTTTILEVFADDSPGLLYAIAKAIFESGLSVRSAKIGTYLDQVVDAFHVTDGSNRKISDPRMLDDLRSAVQSAIATLCR